MVPALTASSVSFTMASINSLGGGAEGSACLTIIMNRIVFSPFYFGWSWTLPTVSSDLKSGSICISNEELQNRHRTKLFFHCDLLSHALLLLSQFGRELGTEIFRLEYLANLDLRLAFKRIRAALDPLHRLFHRPYLPQPEAGDQFLGLGEWPVDHTALWSREPYSLAFRTGLEPFASKHHARFCQFLVELTHCGEKLSFWHDP